MRKLVLSAVSALAVALIAVPAFATNGTNIIGVGTLSRSMGGVGAAAPQDAITAVFGNPAAMCYIPCETSEVDFAGTVFDPTVKAKVTLPSVPANALFPGSPATAGGEFDATSKGAPYAFPAIGIYTPISEDWRFGLAAYGVSGLGVDYKDTRLRDTAGEIGGVFGPFDVKTDLQIMKFAPNIAYKVMPNLSVGAAVQLNWAQLDLGDGSSHDFGFGTQIGVIYKPVDMLSLGVTYQSPQQHVFKRVFNFNRDLNGDGLSTGPGEDSTRDTLKLEQPQQVVLGVAVDAIPNTLLLEVDGKWINWSNANGYKDFDWDDQYVIAVGMQYKPVDWLAMRVGYNYGKNPVNEHNGFNFFGGTTLQGTPVSNALFEGFRVVGFPAVVEHHMTCGVGVNISKKVSLNLGYMHAFHNKITESDSSALGSPVTYESRLEEDSYEFGVNIMF